MRITITNPKITINPNGLGYATVKCGCDTIVFWTYFAKFCKLPFPIDLEVEIKQTDTHEYLCSKWEIAE